MKIELHPVFQKNYKRRIAFSSKLVKKFQRRVHIFLDNPHHPTLRNHKLIGEKISLRAFSISGDLRVVYKELGKEHVLFLDIGTHNQVY